MTTSPRDLSNCLSLHDGERSLQTVRWGREETGRWETDKEEGEGRGEKIRKDGATEGPGLDTQ